MINETFEVDVIYPYQSAEKNQISLAPKERILVLQPDASGWWIGKNSKGEVGIFPSTYTSLGQTTGNDNDPLRGLDKNNKAILWKVIDQLAHEKRQLQATITHLKESNKSLQERVGTAEAALQESKAQREATSNRNTPSPSPRSSPVSMCALDMLLPPPQPHDRRQSHPRATATPPALAIAPAVSALRQVARTLSAEQRQLESVATGQLQSFGELLSEYAMNFSVMQQRMLELNDLYRKEVKERKALYNSIQDLKGKVRVYCRMRPQLPPEKGKGEVQCAFMEDDFVRVEEPKKPPISYELDACFAPERPQEDMFEEVKTVITSVLDGYNVCVFAYGQTGSGKTYTMEGPPSSRGITYRTVDRLFEEITMRRPAYQYSVSLSVIEVYNDNLFDMLRKTNREERLEMRTVNGRSQVLDATQIPVEHAEEVPPILTRAFATRSCGATLLNERSSRSHCLVTFLITGVNTCTKTKVTGKLNLIDLAGSERTTKSKAEGDRLSEANSINKSLSNLGRVICALHQKQSHIPYRDSKLTMLLQDSLCGDSKTVLIATINPNISCASETHSTLAFACSVRRLELGEAKRNVTSTSGKQPRARCKSDSSVRRGSKMEPPRRHGYSADEALDYDSDEHSDGGL